MTQGLAQEIRAASPTLSRPNQEGEMDTKPKADKPTDFELEQAIFEAP